MQPGHGALFSTLRHVLVPPLQAQAKCRVACAAGRLVWAAPRCQAVHPVHPRAASTLAASTTASMPPLSEPAPFAIGTTLRGDSGRTYCIQEVLSVRQEPFLCVYRANENGQSFVIKDLPPANFDYCTRLQGFIGPNPNLRTFVDTIPERNLLVYRFMTADLLELSHKHLSLATKRTILQSALAGLAALHDRHIVHTDIKPGNILVDYDEAPDGDIAVKSVQIADLEEAVCIRSGTASLDGCLCGNKLWRSPESWACAHQGTSSDMFSFGVVAVYVMLGRMILLPSDEQMAAHDAWRHILQLHLSVFGDVKGIEGLLRHIGHDNIFYDRIRAMQTALDVRHHRSAPSVWKAVDADFRDLVIGMTNLDPTQRTTAWEALEHPWFRPPGLVKRLWRWALTPSAGAGKDPVAAHHPPPHPSSFTLS